MTVLSVGYKHMTLYEVAVERNNIVCAKCRSCYHLKSKAGLMARIFNGWRFDQDNVNVEKLLIDSQLIYFRSRAFTGLSLGGRGLSPLYLLF